MSTLIRSAKGRVALSAFVLDFVLYRQALAAPYVKALLDEQLARRRTINVSLGVATRLAEEQHPWQEEYDPR